MTKNQEIIAVFNQRYACKKFDVTKKVSPEDFATIMEAAQLSPSSFGFEPWKFLLIENPQVKNDLRESAWGALNALDGASHFVIALSRKQMTAENPHIRHMIQDIYGMSEEQTERRLASFRNFQEKDFDLVTNERALFDWSSKQSYLALANMMTTAQFLGIDSCPIEGFNKSSLEKYLADHGYLDLNEFGVSYMVGFGYRDEEQPIKKRQSLADILQVIE